MVNADIHCAMCHEGELKIKNKKLYGLILLEMLAQNYKWCQLGED